MGKKEEESLLCSPARLLIRTQKETGWRQEKVRKWLCLHWMYSDTMSVRKPIKCELGGWVGWIERQVQDIAVQSKKVFRKECRKNQALGLILSKKEEKAKTLPVDWVKTASCEIFHPWAGWAFLWLFCLNEAYGGLCHAGVLTLRDRVCQPLSKCQSTWGTWQNNHLCPPALAFLILECA